MDLPSSPFDEDVEAGRHSLLRLRLVKPASLERGLVVGFKRCSTLDRDVAPSG